MKLHLVDEQIKKLSDIAADLGLIMVASVILPAILQDKVNLLESAIGSVIALLCWLTSLRLLKKA